MDFDVAQDTIYFSDVKKHRLYKIFVNGTGQTIVSKNNVPSVEGLSIDWIGRLDLLDLKLMKSVIIDILSHLTDN